MAKAAGLYQGGVLMYADPMSVRLSRKVPQLRLVWQLVNVQAKLALEAEALCKLLQVR